MSDPTVQNLQQMDKSHTFLDGSHRSVTELPSIRIGRGVYEPGWRWSQHAGPQTGKNSDKHIGYIESGLMTVKSADGLEKSLKPGDIFEIKPGHDAWVVGDEPCIALDFEMKTSVNKF